MSDHRTTAPASAAIGQESASPVSRDEWSDALDTVNSISRNPARAGEQLEIRIVGPRLSVTLLGLDDFGKLVRLARLAAPHLAERLCRSLAFHLIESELTLSYAEGDLSEWRGECDHARALIKEAGFDIDVLYPVIDRPTCTEQQ